LKHFWFCAQKKPCRHRQGEYRTRNGDKYKNEKRAVGNTDRSVDQRIKSFRITCGQNSAILSGYVHLIPAAQGQTAIIKHADLSG